MAPPTKRQLLVQATSQIRRTSCKPTKFNLPWKESLVVRMIAFTFALSSDPFCVSGLSQAQLLPWTAAPTATSTPTAIERLWSFSKQYAREHCSFSFDAPQWLAPEALDSIKVCMIRRFFRKSARFLSRYNFLANCSPMLVEYLADEKSFKLQHRVSQNDLNDLIAKLEVSPSLGDRAKVMLKELKECQKLENQFIRYADVWWPQYVWFL